MSCNLGEIQVSSDGLTLAQATRIEAEPVHAFAYSEAMYILPYFIDVTPTDFAT